MTMHTENWAALLVRVVPILLRLLFGSKETKGLLLNNWKKIDPRQRGQ